ncbi:MAG: tRNA (N6-isopentenyl adenosine(37)-C2)-methylthiotransferase MiaB [Bacteroidetes bacterium]|nr:tRNA (N6-isopentenyl adenosine(37)-C2)-methylthiotransferase MiaB [Bacteroidota bacterium]MCW5895836.1 tRNA (N6-isopentenyl adenosine(37)-C2)-methylthiotransferase MiaB [Bacteroidota bacterium]
MKRVYIETYGCQMNMADSEVVGGILARQGYGFTNDMSAADVILVNTCAIRDNAEQRIYGRIGLFGTYKKQRPGTLIGILGCMAERLRFKLVEEEKLVDLVVGPDEYRKLPELIENAFVGEKGIATRLSRVENYEDIVPLRTDGISAWLSVMRGCDKFCSFCVVPFTRGRERSRSLASVVEEVRNLAERGFKEVTLLGQNVNSYSDGEYDFADLMRSVAEVDRTMRIRFTTSHPQDMSDKLIGTIAANSNICKYIHLPVQSASNRILELMNRTYTIEHYLGLVEKIRTAMPDASLTTDIISGFPSETEEEHRMTVELMREVRYDGAYTFKYSPRENTKAWELVDDIPEDVKGQRVFEISQLQQKISQELNQKLIGKVEQVLVEGPSKKSDEEWTGRTDTNRTVIFSKNGEASGEYVDILIERCNPATLFGKRAGSHSDLKTGFMTEMVTQ